jgi:CheY-like chemotaxis protein
MSYDPPTTVLFVDDSTTDRTRGVGLLRKQQPDWLIVPVSGGAEALELLAKRRIDAVITDLVMPEMDGRELLAQMGLDYPNTPVVLITSQGNDQIAAQSMELGAVNYVPKRNLSKDLSRVICDILSSRREARLAREVLRNATKHRTMFRIANDLEQIRSLVHFVRLRLHGLQRFGAATVRNVTAAVRESLLNAYFHGNLEVNPSPLHYSREDYIRISEQRKNDAAFSDRQIELELNYQQSKLEIRIADDGPGFDRAEWTSRCSALDDDSTRGHGLSVIQDAIDTVAFNDQGSQITLTKKILAEHDD